MKLSIGIVTVDRPGGYIHDTMKSLRASGFFDEWDRPTLHLFSGQPEARFLSEYESWPKTIVHFPSRDELSLSHYETMHEKNKCGYGHWRAMSQMADWPADGVLILEDDVQFARGWWPFIQKHLDEISSITRGTFVCQLYRLVKDVQAQYKVGRRWFWIENWTCFGTQANVYSRALLKDLSDLVWKDVVTEYECPIDAAVIKYTRQNAVKTYALAPSVVQHVGRQSTGQTPYFHEADFFRDDVTEL